MKNEKKIICLGAMAACQCMALAAAGDFLWETGALVDALPVDPRMRTVHLADGFRLVTDREYARPGERYVEALMVLDENFTGVEGLRWKVELTDVPTGSTLAAATENVAAQRTLLSVDVRRHDSHALHAGRLRVELHGEAGIVGAAELPIWAEPALPVPAVGERVEIMLDRADYVASADMHTVTFGVPFPAGALWQSDSVRLVDKTGNEMPSQSEVTARWGREGSVRWLRMDAEIPASGNLYLEHRAEGAGEPALPRQPVELIREEDAVIVRVAGAEYVLRPGISPVSEIRFGGRLAASASGTRGLYVVDQNGQTAFAAADNDMRVEAEGPLAASVRFEGFYRTAAGEPLARHITRLEFFAGRPSAAVTHTFVLTEDTRNIWFDEVGWELAVAPGEQPEALFGLDSQDAARHATVPLQGETPAAASWQCDYTQFGGGEKHFQLLTLDASGRETGVLDEGAELGDWAALRGTAGGLMFACRFAARLHPKEFTAYGDRMRLLLFSPRGGASLDFRPPALLERWSRGGKVSAGDRESILDFETSAVGWSRTHEILILPLAAGAGVDVPAEAASLHRKPVYASADPGWVYRSRVLGPLYPRNPERFPAEERFIEKALANYLPRGHEQDQEYGFVDYFAGPHYNRMGRYRYRNTYVVRKAAWLLYARSGDRLLREWAEGTNRTYHDSYMRHWDAEGGIRGFYIIAPPGIADNYPFYWHGTSHVWGGGGGNTLNQYLWDYYLTGYRRAGEVAEDYGNALRRWWKPGMTMWGMRYALYNMWVVYGATWDQDIRLIIEDFMRRVYDPDHALAVHRDAVPYRTSYKATEGTIRFIEAWDLFGDRRCLDIARRMSEFSWTAAKPGQYQSFGHCPLASRFDKGGVAEFLYRLTGAPSIPAELARSVRQALAGSPGSGVSLAHFRLIGLPYALAVLAETDADREPTASWAAYNSFGYPAGFVVRKDTAENLNLHLRGSGVRVSALGDRSAHLISITENDWEAARVNLPPDTPDGDYLITPAASRDAALVADGKPQLVVYAPEYWQPSPPAQKPPLRVFFRVPEITPGKPSILFEAPSRLFDPDGVPFQDGQELRGRISLPENQTGIWSFEADTHGLVNVRNLPPFFALGSADRYFTPELDWTPTPPVVEEERPLADEIFVRGRSRHIPGDQALHLDGSRRLVINAGPPHPSGDGGQFLPHAAGTVEFFIKPFWDTFELYPDKFHYLLEFETISRRRNWHLLYGNTGQRSEWEKYVFDALVRGERHGIMCLRRAVVERDAWMHIAFEWGVHEHFYTEARRPPQRQMTVRVYVNGRVGDAYNFASPHEAEKWSSAHPPLRLVLGRDMPGLVDGLRISDIRRYRGDFEPPASQQDVAFDEHTRLLMLFDGNLDGESYGWQGALTEDIIVVSPQAGG